MGWRRRVACLWSRTAAAEVASGWVNGESASVHMEARRRDGDGDGDGVGGAFCGLARGASRGNSRDVNR